MIRYAFALLLLLFPAVCLKGQAQPGGSAPSQASGDAAREMARVAPLYDTPGTRGLKSFHCDVSMDWKAMLERFSGAALKPDDPALKELEAVHLSTDDDLSGEGSLTWTQGAGDPANATGVGQMRDGMKQMFYGFYKQWNLFAGGQMVRLPSEQARVEREGRGLHVIAGGGDNFAEERYDEKLVLQSFHVQSPQLDLLETPAFVQTPRGLQVTALKTELRQPPAAAPVISMMSIRYAETSGFGLPSALNFAVAGIGTFEFHLQNCVVNPGAAGR